MKSRIVLAVTGLFLIMPPSALSAGKGGAPLFTLTEETHDGYLLVIRQTTSVDYRSSILIQPARSLHPDQPEIRTRVEVLRRNGRTFQIPLPQTSSAADSSTTRIRIHLEEWAVEPGDKVHIVIRHDFGYPYVFERSVKVRRHGLGASLSFPILSVQRGGDHPGGLGAGVSYTLKHVQAEKTLLNHLGVGLNLSVLDFEPAQKIEIGLGLVVTFPDDLFQIGFGKNLTIDTDSGYYFLGINLPGIKDKIGL